MEEKLESLIQKIEREAVDGAQQKADALLEKAQIEARNLVDDARKEAARAAEDAQRQSEDFRKSAEDALQQAARDVELQLKERLAALFDRVFRRKVAEVLEPGFLKDLILRIAGEWSGSGSLEISLRDGDLKTLEAILFEGIQEDMKQTIVLSAGTRASRGFRIGVEGESVYYDFTEGAIAEALRECISPRLREILDRTDG